MKIKMYRKSKPYDMASLLSLKLFSLCLGTPAYAVRNGTKAGLIGNDQGLVSAGIIPLASLLV